MISALFYGLGVLIILVFAIPIRHRQPMAYYLAIILGINIIIVAFTAVEVYGNDIADGQGMVMSAFLLILLLFIAVTGMVLMHRRQDTGGGDSAE